MGEHSPFLDIALEAVKRAEEVIMRYYREDKGVTLKSDGTAVTVADREAEKVIIDTIRDSFPDHSILGEESGEESGDSEYLWVIDPIDGTSNYIRGIPLFGIQLALMKDGEVILGVSNAPALNELVYAQKGEGAYGNGKRIEVSGVDSIGEAYVSFGSIGSFSDAGRMGSLISLNLDTRGHRGFGDFWSYHLLAWGKIDIMVEARIKIWDVAALSGVVEEAGGRITDMSGNRITRNTTSVIATNGLLHDKVLAYFRDSG